MIYLLGMSTQVVIGTSLFQILFVTMATTMTHATTTHAVDLVLAFLLLIGSVVGAQIGGRISTSVRPEYLRIILAFIVLIVAIRMALGLGWRRTRSTRSPAVMRRARPARIALALLAAPLLLGATTAPILVPDVSQRDVEIRFSFTGAELLLFGAIIYPGGLAPTEPADIIVVLKGPSQAITMREKQKFAGLIWVNADSIQFRSAPSFYAIASSRPLKELVDERTAAIYELGLSNLQLSPSSVSDSTEISRFATGLNGLKGRNGLYLQSAGRVEITDGVLYRARLPLSARVVTGTYTAETFLIQKGRVVAAAVREVEVRKSGFERFFGQFAQQHDIAYGLTAIFMALGMGLFAGFVARRV